MKKLVEYLLVLFFFTWFRKSSPERPQFTYIQCKINNKNLESSLYGSMQRKVRVENSNFFVYTKETKFLHKDYCEQYNLSRHCQRR